MRLGVELLLIDGPRYVFDPEQEQHKFVEESRQESLEHEGKRASNLLQKKSADTKGKAL